MDKKTNLLLIAAVGFIAVFTIVIISVNNWLKTTLKEETTTSQPASVGETPTQKYRQVPIVVVPEQNISVNQKETLKPEAVTGEKSVVPVSPPASGRNLSG